MLLCLNTAGRCWSAAGSRELPAAVTPGLSHPAHVQSAALWDLGASRCAELPPPLEGVELRRILCFHGNGKAGSLSVLGCAGSEAMAGLHPSGDPCSAPWQQPRLLLHYITASRAGSIPWDVPGQPAARRAAGVCRGGSSAVGWSRLCPAPGQGFLEG